MLRYPVIILLFAVLVSSCEKSPSAGSLKLRFSEDTIHFDTVFTTVGTTTKELRVINNQNRKVVIDNLFIAGGSESQFRLNIDGEPAWEKRNVELEAGDSLFIFIDVLIDPTNIDSPLSVTDSIIFEIGSKLQQIQLMAWGQDVNLVENKLVTSQTWHNNKPYVIYNNITVDSLETLIIEEGTKVYFHRNGSLTIAGNLIVNGTIEHPVIFGGDRLEEMYKDIPGQWKGIFILNPSRGNSFNHAVIRNTIYGIQLGETTSVSGYPDLKLFSTIISHSTISGLSAINGKVESANCVISHCGSWCIRIAAGGDYDFTHCTLYNIWDYGFRISSLLHVSEKAATTGGRITQLNLNLNNSVIFGNNTSEIEIIPITKGYNGNYLFDHCLIKLDTVHSQFWSADKFPGSFVNKNPLFIGESVFDFRPDTLSPLINRGNLIYLIDYPIDIRGKSRNDDGLPDIGAYERITGEHKMI